MKKLFFFKGVSAHHVKVSHAGFVGLPSITGMTGLNRNFAIQLARALDLAPSALQPAGALLAFEGYHLHEGYKKGHKAGQSTYESIPAAWASFTAHIALEVEATTPEAQEKMAGADLPELAVSLLEGMSLCKGALRNVRKPINLAQMASRGFSSERDYVMHLLPSSAQVVRDYSYLISSMRAFGIPLMEGLVAATLRHSKRPMRYREFFEHEEVQAHECILAPVMHGLLKLEQSPSAKSIRPDASGEMSGSVIASPAFTISRLQKAASLRVRMRDVDQPEPAYSFWREYRSPEGYFCYAE